MYEFKSMNQDSVWVEEPVVQDLHVQYCLFGLADVHKHVDKVWNKRIAEGDPLEGKCMRKQVHADV